jgi:protein-tyrosine-phosphatase
MAEGILKAMLDSEKIAGVEVISSGTGTLDGYPATANSVQVSAISESLVEASDLIFVLAYDHYVFVTSRYPDKADDVFMLKSFPDGEASLGLSIADPIGADVETYSEVYDEIKRELMRAWPNIIQRINERLEN